MVVDIGSLESYILTRAKSEILICDSLCKVGIGKADTIVTSVISAF